MSIPRPESFVHLPMDTEVEQVFTHDSDQPVAEFERNTFTMLMSREMALDCGLVEPTPEEAERREAELVEFRAREAARAVSREHWLTLLREQVGDVGRNVLALHGRTSIGDCTECTDEDGPGTLWPCPTVRAVAEAVDVDVPDGI